MNTSSNPPTEHQEDLLAAAAFGTLTESERAEFESLLESSPGFREEFASLQALTADLALLAPESDPSPAVRDRLEEAISFAPPIPQPLPPTDEVIELTDHAGPIPINLSTRRANPYEAPKSRMPSTMRPYIWAAAAAVVLALVAGVMLDRIFLQDEDSAPPMEEIAFELNVPDDPGISGELMYDPESHMFMLETENMPAAPEGQVYQVWLIDHEGVPQPKGVMDEQAFVVKADRSDYQAFAITMEPGPLGSTGPTSDPILVAPLTPEASA
jgi:anti-sigma-K factor RskA